MRTDLAFEVVRASAGSGKTYRLVSRYLACCLVEDDPMAFRHILALTFTNKAAWEMKERILRDLLALGKGTASPEFVGELVAQTGQSPDVLSTRARAMRAAMLHRYSLMSVMTLDSFTNRLVRSFARDLALDQDYRIELDQQRIVEEAVSNVLDRVGEPGNEAFTDLLRGFARMQVEEDRDSRIRKPLMDYGSEVLKEGMRNALEAVSALTAEDFMALSRALRAEVREAYANVERVAKEVHAAFEAAGVERKDVSRGTLVDFVAKNAAGTFKPPTPGLRTQFESGVFTASKATPDVVARVAEVVPAAERLRDAVDRLLPETEEGREFVLKTKLVHKIDLIGTIASLAEAMEEVQQQRNVRTFHALHERVARVVRHNPVPFLFERMGSRYRHVFIDEFQDTSVTQWQNLVPLVDHVLAERHRTLVVGDSKQAIYRWRNGDYRQLMALPDLVDDDDGAFQDAAQTFKEAMDDQVLEDNWRSGKAIVSWNNALFEEVRLRLPESLQEVYDRHQQRARKAFDGGVHLQVVANEDKESRVEAVQQAVLGRLRHHHDVEGFAWSNMAVLVRTNREGAALAQRMLNEGILPQTEDSLHLGRHPAALAVIHLTRWVVQPSEHRFATGWLQCMAALDPDCYPEAQSLDRWVFEKGETADGVKRFNPEGMILELVPRLELHERSQGPLVSWVGHVCDVLGVAGTYDAYAEGLMELALEVAGTDDNGLTGFLRAWDRKGATRSIVTPGAGDAVQIMTVHKAKGLAFPVTVVTVNPSKAREVRGVLPTLMPKGSGVKVPAALLGIGDMKGTALESRAEQELDAALLDQINILYVAMTRPVERLDVVAELTDWEFDRATPSTASEWVVACAEKVGGHTFGPEDSVLEQGAFDRPPGVGLPSEAGNAVEAGAGEPPRVSPPDAAASGPGTAESPEIQTTTLRLGEVAAQRVNVPRPTWSSLHADGLSDTELGVVAHSLLEQVRVARDWPQVRAHLLGRWSMGDDDKAKVVAWIDHLLAHPASARFFDDGLAHVEREAAWTDGAETLRPDRVVFDGACWHVVDFKTGVARPAKHHAQVQAYMKVLSALETGPVRGWVLYLEPWSLEEVAAEV